MIKSHNPYFNRWFSAMQKKLTDNEVSQCHNPYFNRWFSAIIFFLGGMMMERQVTILILIDGFLQY